MQDAKALGALIRDRRLAAGLSGEQLAARAASTTSTISRLERGLIQAPKYAILTRVALSLGYPTLEAFLASIEPPLSPPKSEGGTTAGAVYGTEPNVVGRVDELRSVEARPVPIFRWGTCGDPRDKLAGPDPDRLDYPPLGQERLVGPNGFGVEVRGESMARSGIHDGGICWVNPDRPLKDGRPVLARCWDLDGSELGAVVKVWHGSGPLTSNGEEGERESVVCARFEVIGPVVLFSPRPYVPR